MKIKTIRFGELEYDEQDFFLFPKGILGFQKEDKFVLLREGIQTPFMWLQSAKSPHLAFVVLDPWTVVSDYQIDLNDDVKNRLKLEKEDQVLVLGIIVIPKKIEDMTINLRAPLVINVETRLGEQIILSEDKYSLRHPVLLKK